MICGQNLNKIQWFTEFEFAERILNHRKSISLHQVQIVLYGKIRKLCLMVISSSTVASVFFNTFTYMFTETHKCWHALHDMQDHTKGRFQVLRDHASLACAFIISDTRCFFVVMLLIIMGTLSVYWAVCYDSKTGRLLKNKSSVAMYSSFY